MEWLSKETKWLIAEMSAGIVLYNLVCMLGAGVLMSYLNHPVLPVIGGFLSGMAGAVLMLIHMAVTTERVLDSRDVDYANKNTVLHSMLRRIIYIIAALVLWRVIGIDLLAMILGTLGMKAGAFLQPWVHKQFGQRSKLS